VLGWSVVFCLKYEAAIKKENVQLVRTDRRTQPKQFTYKDRQ